MNIEIVIGEAEYGFMGVHYTVLFCMMEIFYNKKKSKEGSPRVQASMVIKLVPFL